MTLLDNLAQKRRFRTSIFKIFEGIMTDFSPTKREQEKVEKILKEEKKKEESDEEDEEEEVEKHETKSERKSGNKSIKINPIKKSRALLNNIDAVL